MTPEKEERKHKFHCPLCSAKLIKRGLIKKEGVPGLVYQTLALGCWHCQECLTNFHILITRDCTRREDDRIQRKY
jgi:transcription elongation factor Elf1